MDLEGRFNWLEWAVMNPDEAKWIYVNQVMDRIADLPPEIQRTIVLFWRQNYVRWRVYVLSFDHPTVTQPEWCHCVIPDWFTICNPARFTCHICSKDSHGGTVEPPVIVPMV